MRRREFLCALGTAPAWPAAALAQQPAMPVIGFVSGRAAEGSGALAGEFRKGLSQTGYTEEQNVTVEYHWLEGHYERAPALLSDLAHRGVAVIVTPGTTPGSLAAKAATATIPIVFGVPGDPVVLGLVASLARPDENATGINFFSHELDVKRLGLTHDLLPKASRFAVLVNPANAANTAATSKALKEAAHTLGLELLFFNASSADAIDASFAAFAR
jgi:putative ABC transport system substrate-binding protein